MSWRDELITSKAEALDFLQREFEERQIDASIELQSTVDFFSKNRCFKLTVTDNNGEFGKDTVVFGAVFEVNRHRHSLTISNYVVSLSRIFNLYEDPYIGRDISLVGLKAVFGIANQYTNPIVNIHLKEIQLDGSSFWPYLGAFPSAGVSHSWNKPSDLLLRQLSHYEGEEFQQLHQIEEMAKDYPALAYQELSQIRHNAFKRTNSDKVGYICRWVTKEVFKGTCSDDMTINLRDESTRKIFWTRLGAMPLEAEPPYPCWGRFSEVALEVAKRDGNTAFIKDFENYRDETWRRYPMSMVGHEIPWNL